MPLALILYFLLYVYFFVDIFPSKLQFHSDSGIVVLFRLNLYVGLSNIYKIGVSSGVLGRPLY